MMGLPRRKGLKRRQGKGQKMRKKAGTSSWERKWGSSTWRS